LNEVDGRRPDELEGSRVNAKSTLAWHGPLLLHFTPSSDSGSSLLLHTLRRPSPAHPRYLGIHELYMLSHLNRLMAARGPTLSLFCVISNYTAFPLIYHWIMIIVGYRTVKCIYLSAVYRPISDDCLSLYIHSQQTTLRTMLYAMTAKDLHQDGLLLHECCCLLLMSF
jgi:hypothetical protein